MSISGPVAGPTAGGTQVHDLRRDLVRKLQTAARGVGRGERVGLHRRFVEAWSEFADSGRLGGLARAWARQDPEAFRVEAREPSLFVDLMEKTLRTTWAGPRHSDPDFGLAGGPSGASPALTPGYEPATSWAALEPTVEAGNWRDAGLDFPQVDLFPPELVTQPT